MWAGSPCAKTTLVWDALCLNENQTYIQSTETKISTFRVASNAAVYRTNNNVLLQLLLTERPRSDCEAKRIPVCASMFTIKTKINVSYFIQIIA